MPELYDSLYKLGYQNDGIMTHYSPVLKSLLMLVASDPTIERVLDVGSSHGGGVKALWTMGLLASGVDVAPTAIALAESRHGADPNKCVPPCWTATPATRLPFADRAFDALISTDVLEHLEQAMAHTETPWRAASALASALSLGWCSYTAVSYTHLTLPTKA